MHKEGVLDKAKEIYNILADAGIRVELDDRDTQSPDGNLTSGNLKVYRYD